MAGPRGPSITDGNLLEPNLMQVLQLNGPPGSTPLTLDFTLAPTKRPKPPVLAVAYHKPPGVLSGEPQLTISSRSPLLYQPLTMDSSRDRIVLLFCHGGSLNKHIWTPIVRRLKAAASLQRFSWEHFAIDWRYHGSKSSDAEPANFYYEDGDEKLPRVDHPGRHWPEWAPRDLKKVVELLRNEDAALRRKTHIIGVGHSMGGASLLNVEVHHPGTFAGLILFEPMLAIDKAQEAADWVKTAAVTNTLRRKGEWESWEDVVEHFREGKIFRRWHPESLASYLESGIKKTSDGKKFRLALPLIQGASLYCHDVMVFAKGEVRRMQRNAVLGFGDRTQLYDLPLAHEMATFVQQFEAPPHLSSGFP